MRIMIKGGVWKNTEDEILKAAVMKYGKNQWSRIASLLSRKSAKQCKARWYEWLDPSIKKTEWTKEEDEKLLHLAKIMPTQWRTIAPIVGRTAAQCLERYEKLLDEAMRSEGAAPDEGDDPRRLRPGEIDPNPECKPARPDPVDMDEDEKEMLSEARARLANTRGKKAKRKAREKQLEEARRLASLQKRRELKAAGIDMTKRKKKSKHIDYSAEIPFEHKAPLGFFEVGGENSIVPKAELSNVNLSDLEGKRRTDIVAQDQKKDQKKFRKRKKEDLPGAVVQVNAVNDPQHVNKRARMVLPAPVVSDRELEEIAKMGAIMEADEEGGIGATRALLGSYTPGGQTPAHPSQQGQRVARTPLRPTNIMDEVKQVAAINAMGTPLAGGESARERIESKDFDALTPSIKPAATPNIVSGATPGMTPRVGATPAGSMTPAMSMTGGATPVFRDALALNSDAAAMDENAQMQRAKEALLKQQLKHSLKALPAPKNEYEINFAAAIPEGKDEDDKEQLPYEEDAQDRDRRIQRERQAAAEAEQRRQAQVVQRGLPRPLQINTAYGQGAEKLGGLKGQAMLLVQEEMLAMLQADALTHRLPGVDPPPGAKTLPRLPDDLMAQARSLVASELTAVKAVGAPEVERVTAALDRVRASLVYLPNTRQYVPKEKVAPDQLILSLKSEVDMGLVHGKREAKKVEKLEGRVGKLTMGYQKRASAMHLQQADLLGQIEEESMALETYKLLAAYEGDAIPKRLENLTAQLEGEKKREAALQARYQALVSAQKAASQAPAPKVM
mmetsp:Transcript_43226/g.102084  ORF Transcript_43226/g.102084 Transcript_43226/m.102084 type:complete len:787 (-) Transcript_43226:197-2557(-)